LKNATGALLLEQRDLDAHNISIGSELQAGLYILELFYGENFQTVKLIKQ
jgi:hypothetical protein